MAKLASKVYTHIQNLDFPDVSSYEKSFEGTLKFEEDLLSEKI
jgi:hypothetical protein